MLLYKKTCFQDFISLVIAKHSRIKFIDFNRQQLMSNCVLISLSLSAPDRNHEKHPTTCGARFRTVSHYYSTTTMPPKISQTNCAFIAFVRVRFLHKITIVHPTQTPSAGHNNVFIPNRSRCRHNGRGTMQSVAHFLCVRVVVGPINIVADPSERACVRVCWCRCVHDVFRCEYAGVSHNSCNNV